jgi:hypothetical protein
MRNPDVAADGMDPAEHYLRFGWAEGRWPNRFFDTLWYGRQNNDVTKAGMNPLLHYMRYGEAEGRLPHPLVDPAWYRRVYDVPGDRLALVHFLGVRSKGSHAPSAALWSALHMPQGAERPADVDPVTWCLDLAEAREEAAFPDLVVVQTSGLLDPNFYLINASDVHAAEMEPDAHYCRHGWRESRRPNIYFDPVWYSYTNPEVGRLQLNPLVHYVLVGEKADRRPVPYFEPVWYRETYRIADAESALAHFLTHRRQQQVSPTRLFDVAWYVTEHARELGTNRDPFAHYLQIGTFSDIDPSPDFDAGTYRRTHLGRMSRSFRRLMTPEQHNPLVHRMRVEYGDAPIRRG